MDQILWVVEIYNCEDLPFHEFVPIYENPSEPPPLYACHEGPEEAEGKYYYGVLRHGKKPLAGPTTITNTTQSILSPSEGSSLSFVVIVLDHFACGRGREGGGGEQGCRCRRLLTPTIQGVGTIDGMDEGGASTIRSRYRIRKRPRNILNVHRSAVVVTHSRRNNRCSLHAKI